MRLIVLTGLVTVEKHTLTVALAHHYLAVGSRVSIVDGVVRLPLDGVPDGATLLRGDLPDLWGQLDTPVVIWAVDETLPPDDLFALLDRLDADEITTVALIDTRTCDCFPTLRETLETYADLVVNIPTKFETVIERLAL